MTTRKQRLAMLEQKASPKRGTPRWEPVIRMAYGMPVSAQDRADADAFMDALPHHVVAEAKRIAASMTAEDISRLPEPLRHATPRTVTSNR